MFNRSRAALLAFLLVVVSAYAADPSTAALIEEGHFKRAEVILKQRLQASTNDARSYCELSKVDLSFFRWDDAIEHAETAVSLDGKSVDYHVQLVDALGSKLGAATTGVFQRMSLGRRFKTEAAVALQMDPNNVIANGDMVEYYLQAPGFAGGDKKKASEVADHMVQANPVQGYLLKIEIATEENQTGELEKLVQHAIDADPKNYDAHLQAANFYLGKGKDGLDQAEDLGKGLLKLDPDRSGGYAVLAQVYAQLGRWKELGSLLEDSAKAVPDNFTPQYQAARVIYVSTQTAELDRAERYMRLYLTQPAEGNSPSLAAAHWRLGLILDKESHKDQARQEMQKAVDLDPSFEPARKDLKRLQ